ncbi:glycoside hydrolase family 113 [Protofrankia sp. BMG5.30]|uniref:glycoside hydrolase family 113 n=2 Tax=Protofrankia TaxID=2994361 RepID=UPI00069C7252|nr:hypothetical protein [Protofrankia sp. BMG5.30]ONH37360.1 hypothetical protein BL254_04790 [Protofrankia sp. BMG5.30]
MIRLGTAGATLAAVFVMTIAGTGCAAAPQDRTPAFHPAAPPPVTATAGPQTRAGAGAGPTVAYPWQPGRPELGVQVYWDDNPDEPVELVRAKARQIVDYVVDLEANALCVSFPFFTDTARSNAVHGGRTTPTPERLGILLDEARRSGLRVTLRPTLDERTLTAANPLDWRGTIRPGDRDAWFASYRRFLTPYLALAARTGVATVVIGTELSSLEGDPRWAELAAYARTLFGGETGYAFNWDVFVHTAVRMPVDRVGVDAYPELPLSDDASVAELAAGWHSWLDRRARGQMPSLLLYEVGAPAQDGIYRHPANPNNGGPVNEVVQQRWFAAACQMARERSLAGLYWWRVDFHAGPATVDPLRDRHESFAGRAAEQTIRDCFSGWRAVR